MIIENSKLEKEISLKRERRLEKVSRTFTLSIKILPKLLRKYVGHAYLVCRFLDTLEDTPDKTIKEKRDALYIAKDILDNEKSPDKFKDYFHNFSKTCTANPHEKELLEDSTELFTYLDTFPKNISESIKKWASEMSDGMAKYAFGSDKPDFSLQSVDELEEYTYYVAGTVGLMLSDMFTQDKYVCSDKKKQIMRDRSVNFGRALQYVNIIKDSNTDILEDRCFIPSELLDKYGIEKSELFSENKVDEQKKLFSELIQIAYGYLKESREYTEALPMYSWRIRMFCILPVLLAYATLRHVEKNLDKLVTTKSQLKISRKKVKRLIYFSFPAAFSNRYLRFLINQTKR